MEGYNIHKSYSLDKKNNIWMRSGYGGIAYSDGSEIENHLKSVLDNATDLSVMSNELLNHCEDWPTTYHLTRRRSNLLRPFAQQLTGKTVLEIGSGCGAISRYLGEIGTDLTALEGSPMRASIGASRCRDLNNVTVISDNFQSFEAEKKYDFVTLIGVLEYARHFVEGDDPIASMLSKAKSYLKPSGVLIIAIENQLGLKYLAGYFEDHIGKPMFGIEEHYANNTVVTFGKKDLAQRVSNVGLTEQEYWYPFPDYKLPSLMVSEHGASSNNAFDLTTLVRGTCASDRQMPAGVSFLQERALKPIIRNGLLVDFANSFVLLSSAKKPPNNSQHYALHYAVDRRSEFAKQVSFGKNANDEITAQQSNLYPDAESDSHSSVVQILDDKKYVDGIAWQDELLEIMSSPDWSVNRIAVWWDYWWQSIQNYAKQNQKELEIDGEVDGALIDAMPRNLFYVDDATCDFIDLEWIYHKKVNTKFFMFRALLSSFQSMGMCAKPVVNTPLNIEQLIKSVLSENDIEISDKDLQEFIAFEAKFQLSTGGKLGLNMADFQNMMLQVSDTLTPAFMKLNSLETEVNLMKGSLSWRVTKPLRGAKSLYVDGRIFAARVGSYLLRKMRGKNG